MPVVQSGSVGGTVGSTRVQLPLEGVQGTVDLPRIPRGYYPVDLPGIVVQQCRGVCANDHQPLVK
jgi:hypothetical protein